jgi:predicted Fe-Mo cluster-binding NifX family protein
MKVAFTAWEDRISPVFDSARMLLIANIENERVIGRQYEPFNPQPVSRVVDMLQTLEIEVLICGAISRTPSIIIEASGIKLISFVGGKIDDILRSYANGISIVPGFSMPGCGQQKRKRRRQRPFSKEIRRWSIYRKVIEKVRNGKNQEVGKAEKKIVQQTEWRVKLSAERRNKGIIIIQAG